MKKKKFNPVFKDIKKIILQSEREEKRIGNSPPEKVETVTDDERYFDEAMSDVIPIDGNRTEKIPGHGKTLKPSHSVTDKDQEVVSHLRNLVKGSIDMDITFSDEYIEGSISGVSSRVMRRLKRGRIPVQDHTDLHGLTKKDAETEVRKFLLNSHKRGLRCVLIVHGRGLNSPDSFPVLKESLPKWLNRGPARKIVLAFTTARPYDGGTGAIYVLLRRR